MLQSITHRLGPILLLLVTLGLAAGLRFYNLNWDGGIFAHPDERSTVAFYAPTIHWPTNPADILNPRASRLNPFWNVDTQERRSYTYGHFPLYTLVLVSNFLTELASPLQTLGLPPEWVAWLSAATTGQGFAQVGRALTALADVVSVLLLFLIGKRLYGWGGGLLAAALSTFTVLQIQLAHFFAVDPIYTTFTLLAVYGAMRLYDEQSPGAAMLTGVGIALAVGSKFSALPIVIAPLLAAVLAVTRNPKANPDSAALTSKMMGLAMLALGAAFLIFAVTSPFVLLDFASFKQAVIEEQGNMVSGVADFPFTRQYRNTPAYWYFIEQQLRWGMGWPLGLLGLAGTIWVVGKAIQGKAQVGELLALAWLLLYFGPTGLFLAKFMRYMAPVVPFLSLFGAGLVVALWRWQPGQSTSAAAGSEGNRPLARRLSRILAGAITVIVLGSSVIWSLAFVNGVYGTEHSWITFSRWIYQNVPDGSCIAYEHWDDRMPTSLPEPEAYPEAHRYYQPQLPMYDDDTAGKFQLIRDTLLNCDYVVLATNRLWRTIPRLPERYPMSTRFYQALFSGELGFELVHATETPPQLGPFSFDDQPADESFTVYDHPKPMLFHKTRQLTPEEWDALLGNTWESAVPGYIGEPTLLMRLRGGDQNYAAPPPASGDDGQTAMLPTPVDQLPAIDDYRWNTPANRYALVAVVVWWLAVSLLGWLVLPLTIRLFPKLPDRGYALSKSLGLLLFGYGVWLAASLVGQPWLGNSLLTILGVFTLFALIRFIIVRRHREEMAEFWQTRRWHILAAEGVFAVVYLLFIGLRLLNPDLWHPWLGGEKMLEIGFLNAIVKSAAMPPYDPFFAGTIINYYYYGLFLVGVLIKVTGITPTIAFNLAVPTLAALTAINVFSLAGNMAVTLVDAPLARLKYAAAGLMGVLLVVVMGNLDGMGQLARNLGQLSRLSFDSPIGLLNTTVHAIDGFFYALSGEPVATYNYWDPTRVIPETINEFPFFSFLFADLHPHMIGIPFTLLLLSLAFHWLIEEPEADGDSPHSSWGREENQSSPFPAEGEAVSLPEGQGGGKLSTPADHLLPPEATAGGDELLTGDGLPLPPEGGISLLSPPFGGAGGLNLTPLPLADDDDTPTPDTRPSLLLAFARWLAFPFVLGALAVINTWDLPTYLGLVLVSFLLAKYRQLPPGFSLKQGGLAIGQAVLNAGLVLAVTYLLYLPFFAHYHPPEETGVGLVHTQTPLGLHLNIWGGFIFLIASWLGLALLHPASRNGLLRLISLGLRRWNVAPHLAEIYRRLVEPSTGLLSLGLWSIAGVALISLGLFGLGYRVPAYLLPLVSVALLLLFRREVSAGAAAITLLMFTGLLVLLGVEFFFLRDFLGGGDYYRMNTLFKFYTQVWVIFGVAAAAALPHLWAASERWRWWSQLAWRGMLIILLLAGLIYPTFGTRTRVEDRFPGARPPIGTLDGMAYMSVGQFEWPAGNVIDLKWDDEAIRWLQDHVTGTPVIAEAKVGYYREAGMRVAAYTGLPSILGGLHQNEQHPATQVGRRDMLVNDFWSTPDPARAHQLLTELGIDYIYLGQLEKAVHGPQVGDKFEQLQRQGMLELAFENEQVRIYRRVE